MARSLGRRPIKRACPSSALVLRVRYLRRALHRLTLAYLPDDPRVQLTALLTGAIAQGEKDLRDELRPRISGVLDQVGLKPANCVERLERDRLVEELLDRAVAQGFVNMSDLRDAVARNRLKLPDLRHASEFIVGDPLLKANRQLAEVADGVYRGGEIYRRGMQRLSSVFFGNPVGRFLTRIPDPALRRRLSAARGCAAYARGVVLLLLRRRPFPQGRVCGRLRGPAG